jgi:hypothetical protein
MVTGKALIQNPISYFEEPDGSKSRSCFYAKGPARLTPCEKCPQCGHSDDGKATQTYEVMRNSREGYNDDARM